MPSYYDIDTILAEEELIPCVTVFDMNHLAFLDPDGAHDRRRSTSKQQQQQQQQSVDNRKRKSATNNGSYDADINETSFAPHQDAAEMAAAAAALARHEAGFNSILPKDSHIKIPLWAINNWTYLNYARPALPRHYGRKARERYDADPGDADLRKRNERFFLAGRMLVDVLERGTTFVLDGLNRERSSERQTRHKHALQKVSVEIQQLRHTLVKLYAGERLRKIFDWSSAASAAGGHATSGGGSGMDDDVSPYMEKLTAMEVRLFCTGSSAIASLEDWKMYGTSRLLLGPIRPPQATSAASASVLNTVTTAISNNQKQKRRAVTPGGGGAMEEGVDRSGQRRRIQ